MKKIFVAVILALVCFCGCSKHEVEPQMVTISFNQQMVTGLPMTRGETNDFLDIIAEQTPTYVNVTLKNLDLGKTFTCKSNESITIPVGNYEISAKSETPDYDLVVGHGCIYKTPLISCNTTTNLINANTTIINLNCYYDCYAVFALIDECKTCYANFGNNLEFYKYGKYYVSYFTDDNLKVIVTPYEDNHNFVSTTYIFSTTYDKSKVYAEYGKYYVVHPQMVDKVTSSFTLEIPNMIEGEI